MRAINSEIKSSKYNIFVEDNDSLLIFNSLTKKTIAICNTNKNRIRSAIESGNYSSLTIKEKDILRQMGFLVDINVDESRTALFEYNRQVYNSSELNLVIIPTMFCNFRCVYCPQPHRPGEMDDTVVESIIKFIKRNIYQYKKIFIEWFGGEPLLKKNKIIKIMQEIKTICNAHKTILISSMTTNGYELDFDTFEKLVQNRVLFYQISIDGNQYTHNRSRPHISNPDSFEKIITNLQNIQKNSSHNHFVIGIRINVSPDNFDIIDSLIEYYQFTFSNDKRFQLMWQWVRDWGGNSENKTIRKKLKSTETICKEFYKLCLDKGIKSVDYMSCRTGLAICEACKLHGYVINYNGNIYKCAMMLDNDELESNNLIGKLLPDGKMELNHYKLANWIVPKMLEERCLDCTHYPICMGFPCPLSLNFKEKKICLVDKNLSDMHIRNIKLHQTITIL